MFYCDSCAKKRGWPATLAHSSGRCEVCGCQAPCNDLPSSRLPARRGSPFAGGAGYVASRRSGKDGGWVVVYRADEQGVDVDGQKYAVVCETHGTICGSSSRKDARVLMASAEFCEACMGTVSEAAGSTSLKEGRQS